VDATVGMFWLITYNLPITIKVAKNPKHHEDEKSNKHQLDKSNNRSKYHINLQTSGGGDLHLHQLIHH